MILYLIGKNKLQKIFYQYTFIIIIIIIIIITIETSCQVYHYFYKTVCT